jgi:hypothetical protein
MYSVRRGLGQDNLVCPAGQAIYNGACMSNVQVNPDTGQAVLCTWSNPSGLFNAACWGYGTLWGPTATLNLPTAGPDAPTQAQLDTVAASDDPGAAAQSLADTLAETALTNTQAAINAANPPPPSGPAPFCGTGSTQWIAGIDNCVLLIGGAAVSIFLLSFLSAPRFISRGRN